MAYDDQLADRLRRLVAGEPGLSEKRMFGALAFLVRGNLAVAASGSGGLMVRADPGELDTLLQDPSAAPFEMHGRGMRGWLLVDRAALADDADLQRWADVGVTYARSLPAKPGG